MAYVAKSLEEIAKLFEERASGADLLAQRSGKTDARILRREAHTWREAADFLRVTTIADVQGIQPAEVKA